MNTVFLSLTALTLLPSVLAVAEWGQCGGINYSGPTNCDSGLVCYRLNDWYYQCLKGTATSTSSTQPRTSTTSSTPSTTSGSGSASGFVKVSGQKFTLDGATFNCVGTNSYWMAQLGSTSAITQAYSEIAQAGTTCLRTWGFNDVTSPSGTYYQLWQNGTPTVNTGSNGLGKFDIVVSEAKKAGIRLIVALSNNWGDYGGMDLYISQLLGGGQAHSNFYTNTRVKDAYKNYVRAFVSRYVNEPTILGWELANEPRCNGCSASVITNWASEMSAYIKSIDPNHLIGLGDEGFFNQPGGPSYPYQGGEGVDFTANLKVSNIDFGTFHMYLSPWGINSNEAAWGAQWITDHANVQKSVGKPVLIEEYGLTGSNRASTYSVWWNAVETSGLAGELYWQAGTTPSGSGYNDGYAIFTSDSMFPALKTHYAKLKART